jgi:hypothetical protein
VLPPPELPPPVLPPPVDCVGRVAVIGGTQVPLLGAPAERSSANSAGVGGGSPPGSEEFEPIGSSQAVASKHTRTRPGTWRSAIGTSLPLRARPDSGGRGPSPPAAVSGVQ